MKGRLLAICAAVALLTIVLGSTVGEGREEFVYSVRIEGEIGAGTADYIDRAIQKCEEENVPLIIKIDTPGGLLSATKDIVTRMLRTEVITVVWVTPRNAWAYSAGTYILLASNVAAMDEGTLIGAAQPRPKDQKVTNAMSEWIAQIAEIRGRPPEVAKGFVENNDRMGPKKAFDEKIIDLIATSSDEILAHLGLEGAEIREIGLGLVGRFLNFISNSQIVMLLFILGFFGLIAEITTPGIGLPGVAGVICLLLSLWGMMILRINYLGTILMALGLIMLGYEILSPGFSVFGGGGVVALALGLMVLGRGPWPNVEPWVEVVGTVTKGIVLGVAGILTFSLVLVRRTLRKPPVVGKEELIDKVGVATEDLAPKGLVKIKGELWSAVCDGRIEKGEKVVVKDVRGITLVVGEPQGKKSSD